MIRFDCSARSSDGTPVIRDVQIEEYTRKLLADYKKELLEGLPEKIDPFHFVEVYLGAKLEFQDIYYEDDEQPIYGLTCFNDDRIRVFDREKMTVAEIRVKAGTIILDNSLLRKGRQALFVFCKYFFQKVASKNGECCISVLEKVAGCPAGLPSTAETALQTYQ